MGPLMQTRHSNIEKKFSVMAPFCDWRLIVPTHRNIHAWWSERASLGTNTKEQNIDNLLQSFQQLKPCHSRSTWIRQGLYQLYKIPWSVIHQAPPWAVQEQYLPRPPESEILASWSGACRVQLRSTDLHSLDVTAVLCFNLYIRMF